MLDLIFDIIGSDILGETITINDVTYTLSANTRVFLMSVELCMFFLIVALLVEAFTIIFHAFRR